MSDHAWVLENVASYVAGGLDAAEGERLEQHTAACEPCARALAEARDLDRTLNTLFADVRPRPELEDRLIQSLRQVRRRPRWRVSLPVRLGMGAAAAVVLAGTGTLVNNRILQDEPGMRAQNDLKQLGLAKREVLGDAWTTDHRSSVSTETGLTPFFDGSVSFVPSGPGDADALAGKVRAQIQSGINGTASTSFSTDFGYSVPARGPSSPLVQNKPANTGVPNGGLGMDGEKFALTIPALDYSPPVEWGKKGAYYTFRDAQPSAPTAGTAGVVPAAAVPPVPVALPWRITAGRPAEKTLGAIPASQPEAARSGKSEGKERTEAAQKSWKDGDAPAPDRGKADPKPQVPDVRKPDPTSAPVSTRKIIRSGEIEFEITSFDDAVATVTRLVNGLKEGYVATVNSEKLPNGKVRGSVVVRVPPERLDGLLLDLRKELGKTGELKGQRIGSQDITKQYTDLESRLRAARAMEERLLQIIKTGKGEIKDLLQAEKELGVWRTRIEEFEGELRYYAHQVALSMLTITLYEKEIRAPSAVTETERIQMGIEVEDVEKAQRQALAAVAAAKGRISKAELRQQGEGRYTALLQFEVAAEAAGPVGDRLKQLGVVARLDIDRVRQADDGSGRPQTAKVERVDAQFQVSLYNLANVTPRETVHLSAACSDAEAAYKTVLALVQKVGGRVVSSNLNRQRNEQTKGTVQFEVKTAEADAVLAALKDVGEVMSLQTTENADAQGTTRSKRGFLVQLWALGTVPPCETTTLQVATRDVPAGYRALQEAVAKAKGRVLTAQLNEQDRQHISAQLDFEVRREEEGALRPALAAAGDVFARTVTRAPESEQVIDSKVRWQVKLIDVSGLEAREKVVLGLEVRDVDQTTAALTAYVAEAKGRSVQVHVAHEPDGRVTAKLVFDVPLGAAPGLVAKFKAVGTVRVEQAWRNPQVPDSELAVARLDVTLSNTELIVPSNQGFWPQIRTGLHTSFVAISWSLTVVIIGLCFVLPWAVVLYAVYLAVRWLRKKSAPTQPTA